MTKINNPVSGLHKIESVNESIVHFVYDNAYNLCKAFLRFEEYYESPEWKGKIFTLGQFRQWYSKERGAWTYYQDWTGFNIPGFCFSPFKEGLFDPLSPEEQEVLDLVKHKGENFYVIGTYQGSDPTVYDHEICHALYFTVPKYKAEVNKLLEKEDLSPLYAYFKELGYHSASFLDEAHAYMCCDSDDLRENQVKFNAKLVPKLQAIKKKYTLK